MRTFEIVDMIGLAVAVSVPVALLLGRAVTRRSPTDASARAPVWGAIMGLVAATFLVLTVLPVPPASRWFTGCVALVGLASATRAASLSPIVRRIALDVALIAAAGTFVLRLALMS